MSVNALISRSVERKFLSGGRKLARNMGMRYVVANPVGFSGEDYYPGNSWITDQDGKVLVHLRGTSDVRKMRDSIGVAAIGTQDSPRKVGSTKSRFEYLR